MVLINRWRFYNGLFDWKYVIENINNTYCCFNCWFSIFFFSEKKRRPGHPTLIIFPMFTLTGIAILAERIIREYSKNNKLIEIAGIIMMIIISLSFLSLFISVFIAKYKEKKEFSKFRK